MRLFLVVQALVISFYQERLRSDRLILRMVQWTSTCSSSLQIFLRTHLRLTVFLTKGKRVFYVLILFLVCSGNGYRSERISYIQTSTCIPHNTYYITVVVFVCSYVCTTLAALILFCKGLSFYFYMETKTAILRVIFPILGQEKYWSTGKLFINN